VAEVINGSCSCGGVRFQSRTPSLFCAHCHCSMCRRNHGAGYVSWLVVARDRFSVVAGEDALVRYASSDHGTRSFCGRCGSTLFFTSTRRPEQVDLVLANLDDPADLAPQAHIHWDDRVDWVACDDSLPRLGGPTGFEPVDEAGG
jgi:hypothetical protein